jgi:ABC-type glycerol-3-phosphate transport system substrate-binding protein
MDGSSPNQRRLSRRQFLQGLATAGLGLASARLLAACGAPAATGAPTSAPTAAATEGPSAAPTEGATVIAPTAPAEKQKVQVYALFWLPDTLTQAQKVVETWNQNNGSRIELEYVQGDWGNVRDFLTTSIAGGVAPEVVHGITAWAHQYGQQGAYLDLRSYMERTDLLSDINPVALDAATSPLDNGIYAVPWEWEVGMMYINADRFEAQGIAIPEKGWTWEEFRTAAKKVSNPPEYYGLAANLSATQTSEDIIAWMWQTGAEVMAEKDGKWQIDVEPAREALEFWHAMIHDDKIVSEDAFGGTQIFEAFPVGTYSIMQTGNWARTFVIQAQPEFKWRMVPLPHHKRAANSSQPQTWSLTTDAQKRGTADAGWEIIEYLSNKENQAALAYADWLFPTRQSGMADGRFSTTENDWNLALAEVPNGIPYPKHPAWSEFDDRVLGPNIQLYLQNQLSLDDLMTTLNEEGSQLLTQFGS